MAGANSSVVKGTNGRSRMTNGKVLLTGVDGRSAWSRRFRDLIQIHTEDLGGEANTSAAERSIVRRAAALTTELEAMEARFAIAGGATAEELDVYSRVSNTMRRHLESIGIKRRPREVLSLSEYLSRTEAEAEADDVLDAEIVIDPSPGKRMGDRGCEPEEPSGGDDDEDGDGESGWRASEAAE
jgi:hypothetical protein